MRVAADVQWQREQLEFKVDRYLRSKGWKETSENPICVWLWEKKLADGRTVLVDKDTALHFEQHAEALSCICTDEDADDHRKACPARGDS